MSSSAGAPGNLGAFPAPLEALLSSLVAGDAPFEELAHLEEALTHPSFANERKRGARIDYQRLEFLGDAVLALCVSEVLMAKFPEAREGELSFRRANLVRTEALARFAESLRLGDALRMGRGADSAGERAQESVLADALEALIGAVYVDRGFETARSLVDRVIEAALEPSSEETPRDAKSALQERVQAEGGEAPRYRLVATTGPDHKREFLVEVEGLGRVLGTGSGRSKKLAEQAAAQAGLLALDDAG